MRKSTVFISAVLTTFALVMLYNVASAYREKNVVADVTVLPTVIALPTATDLPAPTAVVLTPEEAAQLAVQVVGNSNLLSAESSNVNGVDAYKITFTNNDTVYIGLDGQVLSVQVAPVVVNVAPPPKHKDKKGDGDQNVSSSPVVSEEDHENSEDHHEEEHED
jgi:hypothetical protein